MAAESSTWKSTYLSQLLPKNHTQSSLTLKQEYLYFIKREVSQNRVQSCVQYMVEGEGWDKKFLQNETGTGLFKSVGLHHRVWLIFFLSLSIYFHISCACNSYWMAFFCPFSNSFSFSPEVDSELRKAGIQDMHMNPLDLYIRKAKRIE